MSLEPGLDEQRVLPVSCGMRRELISAGRQGKAQARYTGSFFVLLSMAHVVLTAKAAKAPSHVADDELAQISVHTRRHKAEMMGKEGAQQNVSREERLFRRTASSTLQ